MSPERPGTELPDAGQTGVEDLLRELAPQVLGVLMRRYAGLDSCEDAVQEALLDAATQWGSAAGLPENPRGWLLTVASRRRPLALQCAVNARVDATRKHRRTAVMAKMVR